EEALAVLRADEMERAYVVKWLMGFVKRSDAWIGGAGEEAGAAVEEEESRMDLVDRATTLLARFAGDDEPEEAVTRTFTFPFLVDDASSPNEPIKAELNDAPLTGVDHTAVGLQSWGTAVVFSARLCAEPLRYFPITSTSASVSQPFSRPARVLELGAGTGLLSIVAAQILQRLGAPAEVLATDYHADVLANLSANVASNRLDNLVCVTALDWVSPPPAEEMGMFDVVLAADVVYEREHARLIRDVVHRAMRKDGVMWLAMPLRETGRHEGMERSVREVFPGIAELEGEGFKGREDELVIVERVDMQRREGVGRADEDGYKLFEIRFA
ncbi:hypothetical protein CONPUDRAFT_16784, partial [Coniophora puteana RWD-64-598 SS2]